MIISVSVEKSLDKIQHLFIMKTQHQEQIKGNFFNPIKAIYENSLCMHVQSLQSQPTLCNPMDSSPSGSSVHQILQARILEWFALPPPGDLPDTGIKPMSSVSPALQTDSLLLRHWESPNIAQPTSILSGEKLDALPLRSQIRQGCALSQVLFNIILEVRARAITQGKDWKGR